MQDDAHLWRGQMLDQLSMCNDELMELLLNEQPVPEDVDPQDASRGHAAQHPGAGALRFGLEQDGRAAAVGCRGGLSAEPAGHAAGGRHESQEERRQAHPQAQARRALLRAGLQDRGRFARRFALHPRLFRPAEGQQPGAQSGQGQEGERAAALADPGRRAQAGHGCRGRRHHRRDRPAELGDRRHAVRRPRADPAGIDPVPRDGHLHGHRAGKLDRAEETLRRAGDDEAAGPDLPGPRERGNRPDPHQRDGRTAPGSDQAPFAPRLQAQRPRPQAAGELSRVDPEGRRGHRRVPSHDERAVAFCPADDSHGAVCGQSCAVCRAHAGGGRGSCRRSI